MNSSTNSASQGDLAPPPARISSGKSWLSSTALLEAALLCGLALAALLPRVQLARQLDVVTDEVIYILGGKIYYPLLTHWSMGAQGWQYNYEHPPLVKLLIGLAIAINARLSQPLHELFVARIPSILFGTLLVLAIYLLGRAPFGRIVALLGALCLAFSPWLAYFSALAYLDMTMTALITIAFLLLWHAIWRPWLYLVVAVLIGLAAASKYTAVLVVPVMAIVTLYYFFALRPRFPPHQRPRIPWLWWLGAILLAPLVFLAVDPAIWPQPIPLLQHSFDFELKHSQQGHLTFFAGQYGTHVPQWFILYIILAKISAFVTIPAAFFVLFALVQQVRFQLRPDSFRAEEVAAHAFLLIWLLGILVMFSLLNIVVGTHYHLAMAAPVALAGASGLAILLRYRRGMLLTMAADTKAALHMGKFRMKVQTAITLLILICAMVVPHFIGLVTVHAAEGYTSEFFSGEDHALQVAYPGYREAVQWITEHTGQPARIGLVALPFTLQEYPQGVSWRNYNRALPTRFTLSEAHPTDDHFSYDFLVWPMHLIQRGYTIPPAWQGAVLHRISGGNTTYCYILANPNGLKRAIKR